MYLGILMYSHHLVFFEFGVLECVLQFMRNGSLPFDCAFEIMYGDLLIKATTELLTACILKCRVA